MASRDTTKFENRPIRPPVGASHHAVLAGMSNVSLHKHAEGAKESADD